MREALAEIERLEAQLDRTIQERRDRDVLHVALRELVEAVEADRFDPWVRLPSLNDALAKARALLKESE